MHPAEEPCKLPPFTCPRCGHKDNEFHAVCPECGRPYFRDYIDTQFHPRDPNPTGIYSDEVLGAGLSRAPSTLGESGGMNVRETRSQRTRPGHPLRLPCTPSPHVVFDVFPGNGEEDTSRERIRVPGYRNGSGNINRCT